MNLQAFLADLRRREIHLSAEGERLRCNAPAGLLTPELREQIRQRKSEILAFLRSAGALARQQRAVVPLQPRGTRTPVYAVAGHTGDVFAYRDLARHLGEDQPFFGLQPPGLDNHGQPLERVEALAGYFATQIREFQPEGPYVIAGYCAGGGIAFELAQQLQRAGATVSFIALFACPYPPTYRFAPFLVQRLIRKLAGIRRHVLALAALPSGERRPYIAEIIRQRKLSRDDEHAAATDPALAMRTRLARVTVAAVRRHVPGSFSGRVGLFLPNRQWLRSGARPLRWRSLAAHTEEFYGPANCNPDLLLNEPDAPVFAAFFEQFRDSCESSRAATAQTGATRQAARAAPAAGGFSAARLQDHAE